MKASPRWYRIWGSNGQRHWEVRDQDSDKTVWKGKTFKGARNAHARLTALRRGVSPELARRIGNQGGT